MTGQVEVLSSRPAENLSSILGTTSSLQAHISSSAAFSHILTPWDAWRSTVSMQLMCSHAKRTFSSMFSSAAGQADDGSPAAAASALANRTACA